MVNHVLTLGFGLCLLLLPLTVRADDGSQLFQKLCSGCHTIGGGDGAGPDLKGVTAQHPQQWLERMITEPDRLTAEKDPAQLTLVQKFGMEMPKLGVSPEDARKIIAFLGGQAAAPEAPQATPPAAAPAAPVAATPELIRKGRDLFTGKTCFAKGGAPCVSCHNLSYPGIEGGTVAADLTELYGRMGETGVRGVLQSLSFPVMKRVYAGHPIEEAEQAALIAFFQDASARHAGKCRVYPLSGVGAFALFVVAAIFIRRRIR